jgi:hypothetical protein
MKYKMTLLPSESLMRLGGWKIEIPMYPEISEYIFPTYQDVKTIAEAFSKLEKDASDGEETIREEITC